MQTTQQIGQEAEQAACHFLEQQGLCLLAQNYRCRLGEIDLILRDGQTLVFAEVRYRDNPHYGNGAETVTFTKQRKLIKTAQYYLQKHAVVDTVACRFDVVALCRRRFGHKIDWIKDAFQIAHF